LPSLATRHQTIFSSVADAAALILEPIVDLIAPWMLAFPARFGETRRRRAQHRRRYRRKNHRLHLRALHGQTSRLFAVM
jgi:hypothetical protein